MSLVGLDSLGQFHLLVLVVFQRPQSWATGKRAARIAKQGGPVVNFFQ